MPYKHVRPVSPVALSPSRAAAATGLNYERVILPALRDGSLRASRIGTKTRILVRDLEAFILSHGPSAANSVNQK
jgi:hypothetical protein